jgi:hypothetical protein
MVQHTGETESVGETDVTPDALLRGDEVSETFADERKAREVGHVLCGYVEQDVDEKFIGQSGDGAGGLGHAFCLRWNALYGERGEAGDKVCHGLRLLGLLLLIGAGLLLLFSGGGRRNTWFLAEGFRSHGEVFLAIPSVHAIVKLWLLNM